MNYETIAASTAPSREPGYYWVRRLNKDGEPIGEPRIAELRATYVTWPWHSMGGENYGHDDIEIVARILPPEHSQGFHEKRRETGIDPGKEPPFGWLEKEEVRAAISGCPAYPDCDETLCAALGCLDESCGAEGAYDQEAEGCA